MARVRYFANLAYRGTGNTLGASATENDLLQTSLMEKLHKMSARTYT